MSTFNVQMNQFVLGEFKVGRSVLYDAPALFLPRAWVDMLASAHPMIALKGATPEQAAQICNALNIARYNEGFAMLMCEAAGILAKLTDEQRVALGVRDWIGDELEGSAIMLRGKTEVSDVGL